MAHVPWTEIENFHNVRRSVTKYPELLGPAPTVTYLAKVKLHGTNAGVRIDATGAVEAFSRSSVITPEADNAGFARWVADRKETFAGLARGQGFVVYGEWCGPGIQKGVAVCGLPNRTFAVFAVRLLGDDSDRLIVHPEHIRSVLDPLMIDPTVKVLPWYGTAVHIDWSKAGEELQPELDKVNGWVADVEACDPWVKENFGVDGTGEGLVFYPQFPHDGYKNFSNLCFKAKGEKHAVVARTKPVQADPTVAASATAFAELVITEARLQQGLTQGLTLDIKNLGPFLKWIGTDVAKETRAELEASGLEPKVAAKACSDRARAWFMEQLKRA